MTEVSPRLDYDGRCVGYEGGNQTHPLRKGHHQQARGLVDGTVAPSAAEED